MGREQEKPSTRRLIVQRFIVALIFAWLAGILLSPDNSSNVGVIATLHREGGRLGLSVATTWNDFLRRGGVTRPTGTTRISIFDIDEAACIAMASYRECKFDRIGDPRVIHAALAAADTTKAKLIIFDILFPTSAETNSEAGRALLIRLQAPGPPIVAPIDYSENSLGKISINWAKSICGRPRCGRLRYAPAYSFDPLGTTRAYPLLINGRLVANTAHDELPVRLPSLVLAAAQATGLSLPQTPDPLPIVYSIPSYATLGRSDHDLLNKQIGVYQDSAYYMHVTVSEDGHGYKMPERAGEIVIIGSSAPVTNDVHDTPLGPMTGMEVVANAFRTAEMSSKGEAARVPAGPGWIASILSWLVLLGTIAVITRIEAAGSRLVLRLPVYGGRPPIAIGYSMILILAIVMIGLLIDLALKVWQIAAEISNPQLRTGDVDLIFPLIAIFFTTGVEISQRIIAKLERGVGWAINQLMRLWIKFWRRLRST
jgi:hypothetical protein